MARRSLRVASSPTTPKKRPAASAAGNPNRSSKRLRSVEKPSSASAAKVTPKKSQYFESSASEPGDSPSEAELVESAFEDEDESAAPTESSEEDSEEFDDASDDDKPRKKKSRGRPVARGGKSNGASGGVVVPIADGTKGKELWRPGVKAGLGPGKQVYIKIPKARSPGRTPYEKGTVHPNTMLFLGELRENNDREWMKSKASSSSAVLRMLIRRPQCMMLITGPQRLTGTRSWRV